MGMAALLPGMVYDHERLGKEIERFRLVLAQDEEIEPEVEPEIEPEKNKGSAQAAYWARMTPAQRRYEMQRRGMTRAKKKKQQVRRAQPGEMTKRGTPAKMHPRDKRHPGHDAWVEKLKAVQKKAWNKRSAA
jgi:hypothetical protein